MCPLDTSEPLRLSDALDPALEAARVVMCKGSDGRSRDDDRGGEGARFRLSSMSYDPIFS